MVPTNILKKCTFSALMLMFGYGYLSYFEKKDHVVSSLKWLQENFNFQRTQQPVNNLTYPAFRHPMAPPYPYPYKFLFSQEDKCKGKSPFLVMMVLSEVRDIRSRNAIRETWGNVSLYDVDIVRIFLVGIVDKALDRLHAMLEEENETYEDIVQQDFMDTYLNLTLKTLMGIEWVIKYCPTASYVMKIDSDMFLNVDYLVHNFLRLDLPVRTNFFTGTILYGTGPMRYEGYKGYIPHEVYPNDTYPPYCTGPGYVFSTDLAKKIFDISQVIRVIPVEDAFMGICMYELNISLTEPPPGLFNGYWMDFDLCQFHKLITVHHYDADNLLHFWHKFRNKKTSRCNKTKSK